MLGKISFEINIEKANFFTLSFTQTFYHYAVIFIRLGKLTNICQKELFIFIAISLRRYCIRIETGSSVSYFAFQSASGHAWRQWSYMAPVVMHGASGHA
jgi:hypothetical protein